MESMSDCGSVLPVTELMERAILIVSADRRYFGCLIKLQNEMGGACGAYGAGEKGVQGSGGET